MTDQKSDQPGGDELRARAKAHAAHWGANSSMGCIDMLVQFAKAEMSRATTGHCAEVDTAAPPKPAPDAMREALEWIEHDDRMWTAVPNHNEVLGRSATGNVLIRGVYGRRAYAALSAPVPPADGANEPFKTCPSCEMRRTCADMKHCYGPSHAELKERFVLSPSGTGAAEPVSDERALELAYKICTGQLSAVQGAVEIMQYATDGVLQVQAATPPVGGYQKTVIALVGKHLGPHLAISPTPRYEAIVRTFANAILSLRVQPGAGERKALLKYLDIFLHPNPEVNLSGLTCKHGLAIEACPARECSNPMAYETAISRARDYISRQAPPSSSEKK